jgi:hypothetical protein
MLNTRLSPEGLSGIFQVLNGVRRSSTRLVYCHNFVPPLVTGPRCFILADMDYTLHVAEGFFGGAV